MMRIGSALAMAAVMANSVMGGGPTKEKFVVKEDPKDLQHKQAVKATNNQYCAVEREDIEICFDFALGLAIGWEFKQRWYDDSSTPDVLDGYYTFELSIFTEQEGNLEFNFYLQRLTEIIMGADATEFRL